MKPISYVFGGIIAGLIGSAIWAAVAYYANLEIGWIAWIIGLLTGIGVRAAAGNEPGRMLAGVLASFVAILCIGIGKYGASYLIAQSWLDDNAEVAIAYLADDIVQERLQVGERIELPEPTEDPASSSWSMSSLYPEPIWAEAERRWSALPQSARDSAKGSPGTLSRTYMITVLADFIIEDAEAQGRALDYPNPATSYQLARLTHGYPRDVWVEASDRWSRLDGVERERLRKLVEQRDARDTEQLAQLFNFMVFVGSFSPWDALWLFLAVGTAYRVATSSSGDAGELELNLGAASTDSDEAPTAGASGFYFGPGSAGGPDAADDDGPSLSSHGTEAA